MYYENWLIDSSCHGIHSDTRMDAMLPRD